MFFIIHVLVVCAEPMCCEHLHIFRSLFKSSCTVTCLSASICFFSAFCLACVCVKFSTNLPLMVFYPAWIFVFGSHRLPIFLDNFNSTFLTFPFNITADWLPLKSFKRTVLLDSWQKSDCIPAIDLIGVILLRSWTSWSN